MKKTLSYLGLAVVAIGMLGLGSSAFAQSANLSANIQLPGSNGGLEIHGQGRGDMDGHDQNDQSMKKPGVMGTVTAISGNTITISGMNGTSYTINASNAKLTKGFGNDATTITLSSIAVGDRVGAQGTLSGNSLTATTVIDFGTGMGLGQMMGNDKTHIVGKVTAVSGNTVTISARNQIYTIDATNAKITEGFGTAATTISVGAIAVGDQVSATSGTTISGTTFAATSISDMGVMTDRGNSATHLVGTITAINGSSFTVTTRTDDSGSASKTITLATTGTTTVMNNNQASTLGALTVGQTVSANGTLDSTGTVFTATSISIDANAYMHETAGSNGLHRGFFRRIGDFFKRVF